MTSYGSRRLPGTLMGIPGSKLLRSPLRPRATPKGWAVPIRTVTETATGSGTLWSTAGGSPGPITSRRRLWTGRARSAETTWIVDGRSRNYDLGSEIGVADVLFNTDELGDFIDEQADYLDGKFHIVQGRRACPCGVPGSHEGRQNGVHDGLGQQGIDKLRAGPERPASGGQFRQSRACGCHTGLLGQSDPARPDLHQDSWERFLPHVSLFPELVVCASRSEPRLYHRQCELRVLRHDRIPLAAPVVRVRCLR